MTPIPLIWILWPQYVANQTPVLLWFRYEHEQELSRVSLAPRLGGDRFGLLRTVNMPHGKCVFNEHWLRDPQYAEWITRDRVPGCAKCVFCAKSIDITNMGEGALRSHARGAKHQSFVHSTHTFGHVKSFMAGKQAVGGARPCTPNPVLTYTARVVPTSQAL